IKSAMKVLQDPTAERIRELVDRIVAGKIAEGQLEEAPLTMRELMLIKQQFVSVLLGMYHHPIDYPTQQVTPPAPVAAAGRASPWTVRGGVPVAPALARPTRHRPTPAPPR